ncbi:MAG: arsenate reductase (glutaredoxin) [Cryomorphaceae bacterium]|nr:arsenate reductase (glutaredoxin) [Cryomorphaceae bacterium]
MNDVTIYHHSRCSKSREALAYLESKGITPNVVKYFDEPLTFDALQNILDQLEMDASEIIRTNEKIWKERFADKELSEEELIYAMIEYPNLMQRPIIAKGEKAVIGRPKENIDNIVK